MYPLFILTWLSPIVNRHEDDARAEAAEVLRLNPQFSLEAFGDRLPYKDPAETERVLAALRKAGLK
jgi:adenylate cyclase